jgi:hypothetical protein
MKKYNSNLNDGLFALYLTFSTLFHGVNFTTFIRIINDILLHFYTRSFTSLFDKFGWNPRVHSRPHFLHSVFTINYLIFKHDEYYNWSYKFTMMCRVKNNNYLSTLFAGGQSSFSLVLPRVLGELRPL